MILPWVVGIIIVSCIIFIIADYLIRWIIRKKKGIKKERKIKESSTFDSVSSAVVGIFSIIGVIIAIIILLLVVA